MLLPNLGFNPFVNMLPFRLIPMINQFLILNTIFGKNNNLKIKDKNGMCVCVCVCVCVCCVCVCECV